MPNKYLDKTGLSTVWSKVKSIVPTKTSDLTNDSNFLTQHQDISGKVDRVELKDYLPLSAGSDKAITGNLYVKKSGVSNILINDAKLRATANSDLIISSLRGRGLHLRNGDQFGGIKFANQTLATELTDDANIVSLGTSETPFNNIYGKTIYQNGKQVANKEDIPTKVSQLENDSGFVYTYDISDAIDNFKAEEFEPAINSLNDAIPTATSELTNDSGYITNSVNNLTNYTLSTGVGNKLSVSINNSTYVMTLKLLNSANTVLSTQTVDLPLETMVVSARYDEGKLYLTLKNGTELAGIDISDLISGLVPNTRTINGKALSSNITLKTSDLTNDSGYITSTDLTDTINNFKSDEVEPGFNKRVGYLSTPILANTTIEDLYNTIVNTFGSEVPCICDTVAVKLLYGYIQIKQYGTDYLVRFTDFTNLKQYSQIVAGTTTVTNFFNTYTNINTTYLQTSGGNITGELTINDKAVALVEDIPTATSDLTNDSGYITSTALAGYQPKDADLTAIAGLTGTSGLLKKTASNTWSLDTTSYAKTSDLKNYVDKDSTDVSSVAVGTFLATYGEGPHWVYNGAEQCYNLINIKKNSNTYFDLIVYSRYGRYQIDSISTSDTTGFYSKFNSSSNKITYSDSTIDYKVSTKQDKLTSGTNIKTINGESILGSGNINISGGSSGNYLPLTGGTLTNDLTVTNPLGSIRLDVDPGEEDLPCIRVSDVDGWETIIHPGYLYLKENSNNDDIQIEPNLISRRDYAYEYIFPDKSGTFALTGDLAAKQDKLTSGTNIKTINGESILGSGNINISGGSSGSSGVDIIRLYLTNDSVVHTVDFSQYDFVEITPSYINVKDEVLYINGVSCGTIYSDTLLTVYLDILDSFYTIHKDNAWYAGGYISDETNVRFQLGGSGSSCTLTLICRGYK